MIVDDNFDHFQHVEFKIFPKSVIVLRPIICVIDILALNVQYGDLSIVVIASTIQVNT